MRHSIQLVAAALLVVAVPEVHARGFGGFRAGGFGAGSLGGFGAGTVRGGGYVGPFGAGAGGVRTGSYVGPRGTTVQAGRAGDIYRGPLGGVHAGGAEGVRVTGPDGRTYTEGRAGGVGVGPLGGVHAHGAAGAAASGPFGTAAVGHAGGVAVGPFGGVAAAGYRGGVAVRGDGVAVGHSTRYISASTLRTNAAYVRTGYGGFGYNCFTPAWYGVHTAAWTTTRWRTANFWVAPAWPTVATWIGVENEPPYAYDYGSDIVINNNTVYVAGQDRGSAEAYAENAVALANTGREAKPDENDEWQPLGVFGLVQGEDEKVAENIFQLAVNKAGVVRGNYYDAVADNTLQVYGSVDKRTQMVAWSVGDKKTVVYEAGLNNLTRDETTVLVHYGKERTRQMVLVRLQQGKDAME